MMGMSAFLLACYFMLPVSAALQPARNLKISSENFQHILTWEDENTEFPIYYSVQYSKLHSSSFETANDCSNVTTRRCDLTKDFTDIDSSYCVRVRSITAHGTAVSKKSGSITPVQHTVLGPPVVDVVAGDRSLKVLVQPPVSHLWSEDLQQNVSMASNDVYSRMSANIRVNEVVKDKLYDIGNNYTLIANLQPNTNYCVSVEIYETSPPNHKPTIPSEVICVVTEYHESDTGYRAVYIAVSVVSGVVLLVILVLALVGLDVAGYICKAKTLIPNVLKPMTISSASSEFTSPTFTVPVEIISKKLEEEQKLENENKNCDGGYANRKRLVDSGTTTSGELPSAVSSSVGSSGQTNSSAEEDLSAGHLGNGVPSAVSITPLPVSASDDSSKVPFDTRGVFNINLNSVSIAGPADVWTGLRPVEVPQEEVESSVDSHEVGIVLNQHNDICLDVEDLEVEYYSDYEDEDVSEDSDSDSHLISGYMKR